MRRIHRTSLDADIAYALDSLQNDVNRLSDSGDFDPGTHWKGKRSSQAILAVFNTLKTMAGKHERCMYCVDSAGSDIEHFWPKRDYPGRIYLWENLLLACTPCGRLKGVKFPKDDEGLPLLVDPSTEDPWQFLDFDPATGNISARYLPAQEAFSRKGEETVKVLQLDRRQGVSEGYQRTYKRLCELVKSWNEAGIAEDYIESLFEKDDHGLLGWFLRGSGQDENVFSVFRQRHPDAWKACCQRIE